MVLRDVTDIIDDFSGRARTVLDYSMLMKRMVDDAKKPGFSVASWGPLEELVAVDEFERMGNFKEVMDWRAYIDFLTNWAKSAEWECSFKRITEQDGVVFLELEERTKGEGYSSVVNSMSVYEFNSAGKICHIDIYLQMELPPLEMLKSYEGVL